MIYFILSHTLERSEARIVDAAQYISGCRYGDLKLAIDVSNLVVL